MDMTKFCGDDSPGYIRVLGELQRCAERAINAEAAETDVRTSQRLRSHCPLELLKRHIFFVLYSREMMPSNPSRQQGFSTYIVSKTPAWKHLPQWQCE